MGHGFTPYKTETVRCWHCRHFEGLAAAGSVAVCRAGSGYPRVRSMPEWGCSGFEREPGADDDPEAVPAESLIHTCGGWRWSG